MSTIKERIEQAFRKARLERDEPTKNVIGMLRAKVLNEIKSGGEVEENDALWTKNLQSYAKQLQKSMAEYEKLGDAGTEHLAEARFELDFCEAYLPQKMSAEETEALLRQLAQEQKISDPKQSGRLVGAAMKSHKDTIDGNLAREIAARILQG